MELLVEQKLMQLAGHLRARALQEWNLLLPADRASYTRAMEVLRSRLDFDSKAVAAQDFRHATQHDGESVADVWNTYSVSPMGVITCRLRREIHYCMHNSRRDCICS